MENQQNITLPIGSAYEFAGIDWRVLDMQENKALLISEKILEKEPYNVSRYDKDITWENCTLRKYLNGGFYNKLGVAKAAVVEIQNNNPNNHWYATSGGNATNDKVFLLSLDEVVKYFGDSGDFKNKKRKNSLGDLLPDGGCISDWYNDVRVADNGKNASSWWLRSLGESSNKAACVSGGFANRGGGIISVCGHSVSNLTVGIRPAVWVNLKQAANLNSLKEKQENVSMTNTTIKKPAIDTPPAIKTTMSINSIGDAYGLYCTDDKVCATCANWVHPVIKKIEEAYEVLYKRSPGLRLGRSFEMFTMKTSKDRKKFPQTYKMTKYIGCFFLACQDIDARVGTCSVRSSSCNYYDGKICSSYRKTEYGRDDLVMMTDDEASNALEIIRIMINELKQRTKNADKEEKKNLKAITTLWKKRLSDLSLLIVTNEQAEAIRARSKVTPEQLAATQKRVQELGNAAWRFDTFGW